MQPAADDAGAGVGYAAPGAAAGGAGAPRKVLTAAAGVGGAYACVPDVWLESKEYMRLKGG